MALGSAAFAVAIVLWPAFAAFAGPPYATDDPEPVPYRHWEFYLATTRASDGGDRSGNAPLLEVNHGAAPDLQLHLVVPLAYSEPSGGGTTFGLGDLEAGAKLRFLHETETAPQIGIFPLLEIPSGSRERGLGGGHVRAFLPIWMQKTLGPVTTYAGGGYWINPGDGSKNWWFAGWQAQLKATSFFSPGIEVFYQTPSEVGGAAEARFNAGFVIDVGERHHVLFSAGRAFHGSNSNQAYLGYLLTLGPEP